METDDEKKRLSDEVVMFVSKRSQTEAPRYTARLRKYVDIQKKRRRANNARERKGPAPANKPDTEQNDNAPENTERQSNGEDRTSRRRGGDEQKCQHIKRSLSRSNSDPSDKCCRRKRRRRRSRRRRRRSCRRRRRRRCSRRRRRRSCRRRRRRRRRRC